MQVSFQSPVAGLIGKLEYSGKFYIRKIHGKYILQRCPNRQNHIPTPHEKANQQRFIQQWRKSKSFFLVLSNDTESSNKPSNND
jgi:hypothetical protein